MKFIVLTMKKQNLPIYINPVYISTMRYVENLETTKVTMTDYEGDIDVYETPVEILHRIHNAAEY